MMKGAGVAGGEDELLIQTPRDFPSNSEAAVEYRMMSEHASTIHNVSKQKRTNGGKAVVPVQLPEAGTLFEQQQQLEK